MNHNTATNPIESQNGVGPSFPVEIGTSSPTASANPEAVPTVGGAHRVADRITRQRDKVGNRLPWFYSHSVPVIEDVPLDQTQLADALRIIKEQLPITGAELEHFYDRKLRPALRRLLAVRDEEEGKQHSYAYETSELNHALDKETERVNQADREAIAGLDGALPEAHRQAARKVTAAGGTYDPENPAPECVLRARRWDEGALASELRLPWTPADKETLMPKWVSWLVTPVVGTMIGLSLGIMSGFIPAGNWLAKPLPLGLFVSGGIVLAIGGKWGIFHSARVASQRYWLGLPVRNWFPFVVISVLITAAIIAMDSFVEREGLMASLRMQEMARSVSGEKPAADMGAKEWLYFLMAIIVIFGYAVNAYWEGYLSGRYDACLNRIREAQERRFQDEDAAFRSIPAVQEALDALAEVRWLLHEKNLLEQRIQERTARIDGKRLPLREDMTEEALRRIQDAMDQLNGTQATFDALFEDAKRRCEGGGSGIGSLRLFAGDRRPRQRRKEQSRRIR